MADALKNFADSLVATAPSPANSGTSLVVTAGQGVLFPAAPFTAVCWPPYVQPSAANAEVVRVTAVSTDTLTIVRAQEGSTAQNIAVGWNIAQNVTGGLLNQFLATSGGTMTGPISMSNNEITNLPVGINPGDAVNVNQFTLGTYDYNVSALSPSAWWKLNDAVGSTTALDSAVNVNESNLLTAVDASFETGTGTWGSDYGPLSATTAQALDGTHSLVLAPTGATPSDAYSGSYPPVVAGSAYTVVASVRANTTVRGAQVGFAWYNSSSIMLYFTFCAPVFDNTTGWTQLTWSVVAPAGAVSARACVTYTAAQAIGEIHYVDCVAMYPINVSPANANLVPDSGFTQPLNTVSFTDANHLGWNANASNFTTSHGSVVYTAATTGTQATSYTGSPYGCPIEVTPGTTMEFSGYVDAGQVLAGTDLILGVYDMAITAQYIALTPTPGSRGFVSGAFVVPVGVTQVRVLFDTNNCTMNAGSTFVGSQFQLTATSTPQPYNQGPTWSVGGLFGTQIAPNNGTAVGGVTFGQPGAIPGTPSDTAALFDGSTGYISTAFEPLGSSMSAVVFYKTSAASSAIIDGIVDSGTFLNGDGLSIYIQNGLLQTSILNDNKQDTTVSNDGAWHCAASVWDGTTHNLYRDGRLVASGPLSGLVTSNYGVHIGWGAYGPVDFPGEISQVAYFPTALTAAQVLSLYNSAPVPSSKINRYIGVLTVAVPSSGVAVLPAPQDRTFYITNGTASSTFTISGGPAITLPASAFGTIRVPAGTTLTPTYTSAPTWVVEGE